MAADSGLRYLLQVSPASGGPLALAAAVPVPVPVSPQSSADHLIERLPDAFVVIDRAGAVVRANLAFLDLVQAGAEGAVVGQSLGRWLSQPGADVAGVLAQVHKHRTIRLLSTTIQGELGMVTPVELSAAADADGQAQHVGVLLRDVSRRLIGPGGEAEARHMPQVHLDKLGQVPLLELVRDASDAVERTYIAAALVKVGGNRTAAADLLGLSRQSLHSKLNRYEIGTAAAKSDMRD
jgi:transcriptional regulator PpsR